MTRKEKNNHFNEYFSKRLEKYEEITFKREDFTHTMTGKIVKVRKTSVRILVNNEKTIDIGFRNII